jgi:hypothetical protein
LEISGGSLGFAKCHDVVLDDLKRASNFFLSNLISKKGKDGEFEKR